MKINQDILLKAMTIKAEKEYVNTCVKSRVCPKCGEELAVKTVDYGHIWDDVYVCSCGFRHRVGYG